MNSFKDFNLSNKLLTTIERLGFTKPTQIQERSIQHIIEGKDLVGESATGSGKTLAFGCGIIEQVVPEQGLQALILTPTRELAEQVKQVIKQLSAQNHLKVTSVYGGVSIVPQIRSLTRAEVVVATPGRLLDHIERRTVNLSKLKLLVLDEADRMLDMGFIRDIQRIIQICPRKRQTLFFSATIDYNIKGLMHRYMNNPIIVSATKYVDPRKLKQIYYNTSRNLKFSLLVHLLQHEKSKLVMVFCNTRRTTDFVAKNLQLNQIRAIPTHGGLSQNSRTSTLKSFNSAKTSVLVCTDVAARGLHIENVSHIYNYDLPKCPKDYIHRIGRTARAGEEGMVINLLAPQDHDNFTRILADYREFSIRQAETPHIRMINLVRTDRPRGPGRFQRGRGSNFNSQRPSYKRRFY